MSIAPHSSGILPSGTGFAAAPAPPVPVMPPPAMSGLAVNTNGSLVSMLPEVTDWFSPAQQSPALGTPAQQTPAAHPCQSGGDCGCGGTCGAASKTITQTSPSTQWTSPSLSAVSEQMPQGIPSLTSLVDFDFMRDVLSRAPGSGMRMTSSDRLGVANIGQITIKDDGSMIMTATSIAKSKKIGITLKPLGNELWEIGNGVSTRTANIPDIMPLEVIATIGWASYTANLWLINKAISSKSAQASSPNVSSIVTNGESVTMNPTDQKALQMVLMGNVVDNTNSILPTIPGPPTNTLCITHDLICSQDLEPLLTFTQNGTSVTRYVPCVGEVNINILDCCKQHDVSLWCASSTLEAGAANAAVIQCIASKIISATQDAYGQSNDWWCKLKKVFVGIWDGIVAIAAELINAIVAIIGEALALALEIVTDGLAPQDWIDWLQGTGGFVVSPVLLNLDGQNSQSCLCGGTVPTTQCSQQSLDANGNLPDGSPGINPCRDVCKEMGKAEDCYPCGWVCDYDDAGNLTGNHFDTGMDNADQGNCCPGTGQYCTGDYQDPTTCAPTNCKDCCWTGAWSRRTGTYWYPTYSDGSLILPGGEPCCKPIPPKPTKRPSLGQEGKRVC